MFRRLIPFAALIVALASPPQAEPSTAEVTAFHDAVMFETTAKVAAALAGDSALATAPGRFGFQAIHMLDYDDFDDKLALLLDHGADINAQNDTGHTLLHILIDPVHLPDVLNAGAALDIRDNAGRTPLFLALTEPDNHGMIAGLLTAGANPNTRDHRGQSALQFAVAMGAVDYAALLRRAGATK